MKRAQTLVPIPPGTAVPLRLFCFPFAGGGASAYRKWGPLLAADAELFAIQLPGRENRMAEAPLTDMAAVVSLLVREMTPYLNRPYALFGHSLGSLVSFELLRELRRRQLPLPCAVVLSGRRAPHLQRHEKKWHLMNDADLTAELRVLEGTPEAVLANNELLELFLPLLRADFTLNESHEHRDEPPFSVPALILSGADDGLATYAQAAEWQKHFANPVRHVEIPGGHFFIDSSLGTVMAELKRQLRTAMANDAALVQ